MAPSRCSGYKPFLPLQFELGLDLYFQQGRKAPDPRHGRLIDVANPLLVSLGKYNF
jgi:hypothetical protein